MIVKKTNLYPYKDTLHTSQRRLQIFLGILGTSLPFVLALGNKYLFGNPKIAPSISHYYYSNMCIYFTTVLACFAVFLINYEGYKPTKGELLSDRQLAIIGGILAAVAVFIPTVCCDFTTCNYSCSGPNSHGNRLLGNIHLIGAGGFLFVMGAMSIFKFTKGPDNYRHQRNKKLLYKVCGYAVWVCLVVLGLEFFVFGFITNWDVLILETVMLLFFGTSWLVKSRKADSLIANTIAIVRRKTVKQVMEE
jgi:hypothetical protein